jgi:hypothetical protein
MITLPKVPKKAGQSLQQGFPIRQSTLLNANPRLADAIAQPNHPHTEPNATNHAENSPEQIRQNAGRQFSNMLLC